MVVSHDKDLPGTGIRGKWLWRSLFGEERPTLFSDSRNSFLSFNPFAGALSSLSPAERYEAQSMGASEFLTRRVNEELQRAFEAGVPSSQLFYIGTPNENTTSEGFRSAVSSAPVQSASAAPARLLSSPGGMSDVGSILTLPELPLRDPPRMAGSYGVSMNDPVFGILLEVFLVRIQVIDLHHLELRFHLHLYKKELGIQLLNC